MIYDEATDVMSGQYAYNLYFHIPYGLASIPLTFYMLPIFKILPYHNFSILY